MDTLGADTPTGQQFSAGQELAYFLSCCGILEQAWEETRYVSMNNVDTHFSRNEYNGVEFVSFPSFCEGDNGVGSSDIKTDNTVFSDRLKGDDDQPALVSRGVLNIFLHILKNSDLEKQMENLSNQDKEREVIFVGHSIGGAVATLATIFFLDKRLKNIHPLCITFGSPLVGDNALRQSIGYQDWAGRFCHVVSKQDVPRMLLAQYEPFGTYMFCSTVGAACIEDSQAVRKMLDLTLQSIEMPEQNDIARYGDLLKHVIESGCSKRTLSPIDMEIASPIDMGIALQLEAIGFQTQNKSAFDALEKARKRKKEHDIEIEKLNMELSQNQSRMAQLEWYIKRVCKGETLCSYDVFKDQTERRDFEANLLRRKLSDFWDEIIGMVNNDQLPSDFRYQNKWINAGTAYRRLVEPLDIADHYRGHSKEESYLSIKNRPLRHRVLEKWLDDKNKTRIERGKGSKKSRTKFASLTEDSCFWARVEEASKDLINLPKDQEKSQTINAQLKESLEKFEFDVSKMIEEKSISEEVFLEQSSFMKLLESMKEEKLGIQMTGYHTPFD